MGGPRADNRNAFAQRCQSSEPSSRGKGTWWEQTSGLAGRTEDSIKFRE